MRLRLFDLILIGVVLIFAFLASSFAVRNSDFWLHLASGRLIAEGRYKFGVDPFCFTTDNQYWANHAWLFDWPLYRLYHLLNENLGEQEGGAVLVVLKALLISLLAFVLLQMRRPGSRLGWPAACTLLAVLAMSPRLLLHSTCLSYVLLGLTLWLLWRPLERSASIGRQVRHYAPLLLLFVLWVNVDAWFLLGPLLALLFWLGERIASGRSGGEESPHTPAWLWLVGLAVCLVNPHHVRAFALPVELMPLPEALQRDVRFESMHASPWQMIRYYQPLTGVNLSGGAYVVLLALGVLSFLLNIRSLSGWRLLIWLAFAGLSAWLVRTIPFFAVVAGPITALNLQEAFSHAGAELKNESLAPSRRRRVVCGGYNLLLLLSALALIGLAWPGWLHGFRDTGRHVDWAVQPDRSLRRVAERLHLWHQQGKLGTSRGFLSYPSVVHYCAWFCPEEKGFLDQRLQLFHDAARPYEDICQAVNPAFAPGGRKVSHAWRQLLRDWGITHVVLYDTALARLEPALRQLAEENGAWTLLDIDGQASIVGWRDGERLLPQNIPVFNAERLAFTEPIETEAEQSAPAAPGRGPQRDPRSDDFWSHFGPPSAPSPWQTEAAGTLLQYFEARAPYEARKRAQRCLGWAASLAALPSGSLDGPMRLAVHIELAPADPQDVPEQLLLQQQPPALPLLAVRTARRALTENPDDANAYFYLGRAYLALLSQTTERNALGLLPPLMELRHIQIAAALENALRLDPDSLPNSLIAHYDLAALYERRRFFDAALDHRRAAVALERRALRRSKDADAVKHLQQSEQAIKEMERRAADFKNQFALQTRTLGSEPYRKAEIALNLGLARLALEDVLMPSASVLLGGEGVRMLVNLQLLLGRIEPVRTHLQLEEWKENKANLGWISLSAPGNTAAPAYQLPAYDWLLLCQSAADGDYDGAEAALNGQLPIARVHELAATVSKDHKELICALVPEMLMGRGRLAVMQTIVSEERSRLATPLMLLTQAAKTQTMLMLLAGMLDLERGRPRAASESFRQVPLLTQFVPDEPPAAAAHSLARTYLRFLADAQR